MPWSAQAQIERSRNREIAVVRKDTDIAEAKVMGIAECANVAMMGAGGLSMTKRQLEALAPEDAAKLDHLQTIAVIAMGNVVQQLGRR